MLHDIVRNVETELEAQKRRISAYCEPSEFKIIPDAADMSRCAIGSLVNHRIQILRELGDKAFPR
jgi:hypothetical protein